MPSPAKMHEADEWKWKVEDAVRTLIRAEEIKKDQKLLDAAQKQMKEQAANLKDAAKEIGAAFMSMK